LSDLDSKIQKAEVRLSEIKIRQRRTSFMWIIYSIVVWIACIVYFLLEMNKTEMQTGDLVYAGLPVLLLPFW
jgi:hypothetical protein